MTVSAVTARQWTVLVHQLKAAIARGDRAAELIILAKLRWPRP